MNAHLATWPGGISAITLFVEDLTSAKEFYQAIFGLPVHFEDEVSAVFISGETMINLLDTKAAPELINPGNVAAPDAGHPFVFTTRR